ncbi:MAG: hypothetical protein ACI8ZM_002644 [Crocinitomix sp.]|jgi:hypothetical protein
MKNLIRINEGTTYDYLPLGFGVLIASIILFAAHWIPAIIVMTIAIAIIAIKTGIEVDVENRQIRKFKQFFGFKSGNFTSLTNTLKIKLVMKRFDAKFAIPVRSLAWREEPAKLTTYDLIIIDDTESETIFNQFTKYTLADKTIKALSKIENLDTFNEVAAILQKQRQMRRR